MEKLKIQKAFQKLSEKGKQKRLSSLMKTIAGYNKCEPDALKFRKLITLNKMEFA